CTKQTQDALFPCNVGNVVDATSVTITFAISWPVPTDSEGKLDPPTDPSTCPPGTPGTTLGPTSITVTGDNIAQQTASVTNVASPFADLVAKLTGPSAANVGDVIQYTGTVTNNGPCPAPKTFVTPEPSAGILFQSVSGDCTADGNCDLGTLQPKESRTFT